MAREIAELLDYHQFDQTEGGCTCEEIWYDTRRPLEEVFYEHLLHQEKVILDEGYTLQRGNNGREN